MFSSILFLVYNFFLLIAASSKKGKKSITNVASSFSKEKVVKPFVISPNALRYKATPRILELAKPLSRKSDL